MIPYIVVDDDGNILRSCCCAVADLKKQGGPGEYIITDMGEVDDVAQKVIWDAYDDAGNLINPRLEQRTAEDIASRQPPPVDPLDRGAGISNRQWQALQGRVAKLEAR